MIPEQSNVENNFNYNYLLVQTILKMRDANADISIPQYWVYFEYGMGLVVSHLDFRLRGEIEQDYAIIQAAFNKINSTNLNPATKHTLINRIKEDFANAHRFYIMQALNRVGVVRVEDEGVIDFESTDLDTFTKIVRDLPNSTVAAFKKQDEKKTAPLIKPEMVLVTHNGKIIQMPKEDYMKLQQEEAPVIMGEVPEDGPIVEEEMSEDEQTEIEEEQTEEPKKKFGWSAKA